MCLCTMEETTERRLFKFSVSDWGVGSGEQGGGSSGDLEKQESSGSSGGQMLISQNSYVPAFEGSSRQCAAHGVETKPTVKHVFIIIDTEILNQGE